MGGSHRPVLLQAVIAAINPRAQAIYVDGTFGGGGYSRALLESADCSVWGIDRDPEACDRGAVLAEEFDGRLSMIHGQFGEIENLLASHNIDCVDGILLDLGVSSFQIDEPGRGFSFQNDGPLDMRMSMEGPTVADIVNQTEQGELADIIFRYGEERHSRRIAKAIVSARAKAPISGTIELADIVRGCYPTPKPGRKAIDPATRTFQALRIYINDELGELQRGLNAAESLLNAGGRLAVVSFHSLEDRIVKTFMRDRSGSGASVSRHTPQNDTDKNPPTFIELNRRAVRPDDSETVANPRARSARLRTAERTDAAPWNFGRTDSGGTA
ncbi:MAG: 16S rRNA (cytosine(1402)-N(4))-methyltransferase [Rhodospirillaceae bacterium]|nr:16S rRNA (cytosine(1402)-N(4))-methyltransferase [Rhodospirillaceae bacterium]|tara:strand:+ start:71629 stop:72612 length:984 start_codon:yes stop_codon:yes gene_type:complete